MSLPNPQVHKPQTSPRWRIQLPPVLPAIRMTTLITTPPQQLRPSILGTCPCPTTAACINLCSDGPPLCPWSSTSATSVPSPLLPPTLICTVASPRLTGAAFPPLEVQPDLQAPVPNSVTKPGSEPASWTSCDSNHLPSCHNICGYTRQTPLPPPSPSLSM